LSQFVSYQLEELIKDNSLQKKLQQVRETAKTYLERINHIFPDYTPHDISHKYKVIGNLSKLIPVNLAQKMNQYEIFFLLCAAYVHDIGMCRLEELGDSEQLTDSEKDNIRKTHHMRIKQLLEVHPDIFGLDEQEAIYVGKIASGHRKVDLFDGKTFRNNDAFRSYQINTPLLAAFLRLSDELDITYERIPAFLYKNFLPRVDFSLKEWQKHWDTTGVVFQDNNIITASAVCLDPEVHRRLRDTEQTIIKQLRELSKHLHHYSEFARSLPYDFQLTIENRGYVEPEVKLQFDPKTIMSLLMGEKLYKKREYAIRELLKNAVDTCRRKRELSKKGNFHYQPAIAVCLNSNRLRIADNGMGMDIEFIKKHFTKVGQSYYKSNEFKNENVDFTPLGELGIGILASFMISEKIEINTKTDDSQPLSLEINNVSDYLYIKELNPLTPTGTTVELNLKDNFINESNIKTIVERFARHLEIQITVNGRQIKNRKYKPSLKNFNISVGNKNSPCLYHIKIEDEAVKGIISLIGRYDKEKKFYPLYRHYHISAFDKNKFFLSNNGMLIQDEIDSSSKSIIPPWLNRQLICGDINFRKHNLSMTLSRDVIIYNEESVRLSSIIGYQIGRGIAKLIRTFGRNKTKINSFIENYIFRTNYHMMSSERNLVADDFVDLPWDRTSLTNLIQISYSFYCLFNRKVRYLSYTQLNKISSNHVILSLLSNSASQKTTSIKNVVEFLKKHPDLKDGFVYILCFYSDATEFVKMLFPGVDEYRLHIVLKRGRILHSRLVKHINR
jgi:hypothetical protein